MMKKSEILTTNLCQQEENVGFLDFAEGHKVSVPSTVDPTVRQAMPPRADLGDFLSRPVLIKQVSWNVGSALIDQFYPWELWREQDAVQRKLNNFAFFRGKLVIKAVINGTPFHYGKIMMSYEPFHSRSGLYTFSVTNNTDGHFITEMIKKSQRMNVKLDPMSDTTGCLCLPFLWPDNQLAVAEAVSASWTEMGIVHLSSMVPLRVTSTTTDSVTVSIFAWVEDVELSVPTSALVPQGEEDEYEEQMGVVSAPAAAVAKAAGWLESIPVIAPFAMATRIGATAVSRIASIFGYSKPALITSVGRMRRQPCGEFAHTSGADNVIKLTMDPKQEVTVDPRVVGLGDDDEMLFKHLFERESYFTYFEWETSDNPNHELFWSEVYPKVGFIFDETNFGYVNTMSTVGFAAGPFQYWSGTLIYRFEIMASQYHKGRMAFFWDPFGYTTVTNAEFNTNYAKILDLEESRNIEIAISYAQPQPYLGDTAQPKEINHYKLPFVGGSLPSGANVNGAFRITVLNELVAPVTDATVRVNVYVRAGEDFEVRAPYDHYTHNITYRRPHGPPALAGPSPNLQPQGSRDEEVPEIISVFMDFQRNAWCVEYKLHGETFVNDIPLTVLESVKENFQLRPQAEDDIKNQNVPDSAVKSTDLIDSPMPNYELKSAVFFGDPVISLRSILKRYCLHSVAYIPASRIAVDNTEDEHVYRLINKDFPYSSGYTGSANNLFHIFGDDNLGYFPSKMTLLNYYTPAFACRRGGLRNKYIPISNTIVGAPDQRLILAASIRRDPEFRNDLTEFYEITYSINQNNAGTSNSANALMKGMVGTVSGGHTTIPSMQPTLMVELPFYSPVRFALARSLDDVGSLRDETVYANHIIEYIGMDDSTAASAQQVVYTRYCAGADDFSLHFFVNAPTFWFSNPPDVSTV